AFDRVECPGSERRGSAGSGYRTIAATHPRRGYGPGRPVRTGLLPDRTGSPMSTRPAGPAPLDISGILADPTARVVVCCGSGGVGKTTTAAAIALRAAEQGRKV